MEEKQAAQEPEIRQQKIRELAGQVLSLARDNILVSLRFLDGAAASCVAGQGSHRLYGYGRQCGVV